MVQRRIVQIFCLLPLLVVGAALAVNGQTAQAAGQRCFPEAAPAIQACIDGRFREYWEANGGLAVFGYPLTAAQPAVNADTGATYLTQYFERQRFELHSENKAPYDVLLGRLGDDVLRGSGRDWRSLPKAPASTPTYFAETGHAVGADFRRYWDTHGLDLGDLGVSDRESLALFGLPLSEPMRETNSSGDTVLTQYFERARLEFHVDSAGSRVLQGRLGSEVSGRAGDDRPSPSGSASPSASASGSASGAPSGSASGSASGAPSGSASAEPSDDRGASPSASASASGSAEASDDHGDDDASPSGSAEASDDHGDDDASPSGSAEASDDHGGHGRGRGGDD